MPYRVDLAQPSAGALGTLIGLGALDVEAVDNGLAAIMPDAVTLEMLSAALGGAELRVSPAVGRDDESIWTLGPQAVRTRTLSFVPAGTPAAANAIQLIDGPAFGTGLHPTTSLCLEAIEDLFDVDTPASLLDIGTGSGILALAALRRGARTAVGIDLDPEALRVAARNAHLNGVAGRLSLVRGGPDALRGAWPLVVANIRAADLMELAPVLARRVARGGRLVLSGVRDSLALDVRRAYTRVGMTQASDVTRDGWTALVFRPTW